LSELNFLKLICYSSLFNIYLILFYFLFYYTETFTLAFPRLWHRKLSCRRVSWHVYRKYISVKWSQGAAEVLTDSCRPFCEYYWFYFTFCKF